MKTRTGTTESYSHDIRHAFLHAEGQDGVWGRTASGSPVVIEVYTDQRPTLSDGVGQ